MLISIIIPIYKIDELLFNDLLNSLNSQDKKELFECVFVIDEIEPKINYEQNIKKKIDKKISYKIIQNKENMGLSISRNVGIQNSIGEYIAFVDPDDKIDNRYINLISNSILNYRYPNVLKVNYLEGDNSIKKVKKLKESKIKAWASWLYIAKKEFLYSHNIFFPNQRIIYEDVYFFFLMMKYTTEWIEINYKLYFYNVDRDGSIMNTNKNIFRNIKNEIKVIGLARKRFSFNEYFKFVKIEIYIWKNLLFKFLFKNIK